METLLNEILAWWSRLDLPFSRSPSETLALAIALLTLLLLLRKLYSWRRRRRNAADAVSPRLSRVVRGPKVMGYAAVLLFFGGFAAWSAHAPLASAAVAQGVVSPDGNRKTIEHLEGGIVRAIHVREGDKVRAGQILVTLEDIKARAEFDELRERLIHLVTVEARLLAEQSGAESIAVPSALSAFEPAIVEPSLIAQRRLFESRRATLLGREQILGQRILQLEAEIAGLREVIAARDDQLALIDRELKAARTLYEKGLSTLPKLLDLERAEAELRADRATSQALIARHRQSIGETRMQLLTMREEVSEKIAEELSQVRTDLAVVQSQMPSREDVLTRTVVTAPVAGTVMDLQVTTINGVVKPGAPLLDLVPDGAQLVIDARIKPTDMDIVHAGQAARVLFPAYGQRNLPQIFGHLRSVSADRLTDERTGEAYFLAKVEVTPDEIKHASPDIQLSPGMPADVMILTGERTVLEYLVRPFIDSITKSFRES